MTLTDTEKLALLERYFTERPSPLFGERLRLMELAFAENPIWMKRKLAEIAPTPAERLNAVASIRSKQSPKRQGATAPIPGAFSAALSTVGASPTSITTGVSTISVVVKDVNGNGLPGVQVVLAATGTGNTIVQPKYATLANGLATGTLSSTVEGTKTVSATANGVAITQTVNVAVGEALPVMSGLAGWWRANGIVGLNDADPVSAWVDSSGNGRDATQGTAAAKPTYRTNVVNGKPVVRYDGTDDFLILPNFLTAFTAGTIFIVIKLVADPPAAGGRHPLGTWGNFGDTGYYPNAGDNLIYDGFGSSVRKTVGDPAPSLALWHVYETLSAANDWRAYLDGSLLFSTATNTVLWGTTPRIGRDSSFINGDIAEVVFYSRALSTVERQQVETYLMGKYGL